jgi:hypothetical protein
MMKDWSNGVMKKKERKKVFPILQYSNSPILQFFEHSITPVL